MRSFRTHKGGRVAAQIKRCAGLLLFGFLISLVASSVRADCVVLVHGLARTAGAMKPLVKPLQSDGYTVVNVDYPSRKKTVEELAPLAVDELGVQRCPEDETVHFVTHSLGGILVRYYLQHHVLPRVGNVVMIAPPNQGSEVVDRLRNMPGYFFFNGPAGMQLGTDAYSIPRQLGPVEFTLGVIAGTKTFNPILSQYLPNPDDGKVSLQSTKVEGMADFIVFARTHTFMMRADDVIHQARYFLKHARFDHEASK